MCAETMSQEKVAKNFGIGQSTVSRILRGEVCHEAG